jgi:hypothetical protein
LLPGAGGFTVNPGAGAIFSGIILIVMVYSTLDLTGAASRMGLLGAVLPLPIIGGLMVGIYLGLKRLKQHKTHIGIKGPLYLRHLMNNCLKRTCGDLERMLNTPQMASATIFNAILLDKILWIGTTDCLRSTDIRRQIEDSGLKGTDDLALSRFFQTVEEYREQELPVEIRQVGDLAGRSRTDLQGLLERLKNAHQSLCAGTGDILALLPPDPKKAEKIRGSYRFTPPTPQSAQRIAFALETLAFLKAVRYKNADPMDHRRYDAAAGQGIPKLGGALKNYKRAWKDLVDAYEEPNRD